MDLNLIYIFNAIYRERNLTRAAEALNLSPSGVSAALRRLRTEFDDALFIRQAHGVEPTVRADSIAVNMGLALNLVSQAKKPEAEFDSSKETRTFIIGMSDYAQAIIIPHLLKKLRETAPHISLVMRHTGNAGVRKLLDEGAFDLVIGNVLTPLGRIRQQHLLQEYFDGVVAKNHPLASLPCTYEELNRYPALLTEGHGNDRWWEHPLIRAEGYLPTQVTSIPGFFGVSLLLLDSPLVCITARRLSRLFVKAYQLEIIRLPFSDQPVTIRQYWHERLHGDPAHRWLRQAIYSVCQTLELSDRETALESAAPAASQNVPCSYQILCKASNRLASANGETCSNSRP